MKRIFMLAIVGTALVLVFNRVGVPVEAQSSPSLQFFKNYFLTGDYVVGGTGLRNTGVNGLATGSIAISGVPEGADIQAAYLYWQVVSTDAAGPDSGNAGVTFRNSSLETDLGPTGKVLGPSGSAPCWASGGGTGSGGGSKRTYTYRADVLRYFDVDTEGKIAVNGTHAVQVPDSGGGGNATPIAMGASLVVVYRDTDTSAPLSAIVLYDGSLTLDNSNRTLTQTIQGFYQPATDNPNAKITYIVGSGQPNKNENLFFEGTLLAANPFGDTAGASWDNLTYSVTPGTAGTVTTVLNTNVGAGDCLSLGAMVFKTAVQDTDGDGLLDVWEDATAASPVFDPHGQELPRLGDMGANKFTKDIFVEIGYLKTDVETSYGGVTRPAHSHLPTHEALKLVGDSFDRQGIRMHFDVGDDYPTGDPLNLDKNADKYIIARNAGLARGGDAIDELASAQLCSVGPDGGAPWDCQFSAYPGTVGWKTGFRYLRDEVLSGEPAPGPGEEDVCDLPGNTCERRFDRNRKDIFHYALFAHALGLPRSEAPCLDAQGHPTGANTLDRCDVSVNPDFRIPRTTTGVGDFPGGDVLVTLGAFPDTSGLPLGTPFMQASTLMHELGHNFERRHSGEPSTPDSPNSNCKPTYLSVMNYLYQLRGLLDDSGKPNLDFSGSVGLQLNEQAMSDGGLVGSWPYRIGWYAPLLGSYLEGRATAAKKHCDGSDLLRDLEGNLTETPMVRIDARTANGAIDWNANGVIDTNYTLDVNFNGRTTLTTESTDSEILRGSNDWANLRLNQVGSRRSVGGLFIDAHGNLRLGMMSLDSGRGDYGRGDYGRGDYGRGDYGRGDYGRGDLGRGDYGRGDYGRGDYGRGDYGRGDYGRGDYGGGDLFTGDPNNIGGELDFETAGDLAKTPPNEFKACVVGVGNCTAATGYLHDVRTDFKAPNVGGVAEFIVYRVAGPELLPGLPWIEAGRTPAVSGQIDYTVVDSSLPELLRGAPYTYFAVAVYAPDEPGGPPVRSDVSNLVTINPAVNDDPTISNIPDQTIAVNTVLGPLGFTIGDERLFRATLTGSSSNTTLVPNANIVFGGSDANRTITVTPALNQSGTTTISVTVTDGAGYTATDTFVLTVASPTYTFTGFLSPMVAAGTEAAPSNAGVFSFGKAIPLKWSIALNGVMVSDLASLRSLVAVPGKYSSTGGGTCTANGGTTLSLLDPSGRPTGNSTYRFGNSQFIFNWDTSAAVRTSCYTIKLTLNDGSPVKATIIRFR